MVEQRTVIGTLRTGRLDFTGLGRAFLLSLALHLVFWLIWLLLFHYKVFHLPPWLAKIMQGPVAIAAKQQVNREPPLMFVDVRESQSVPEPPKNTTRYSDRNSVSSNPDENKDLNDPKIDGKVPDSARTEDVARNQKFDQLMPDPPKPKNDSESQPKPKVAAGTMVIAKAELKPPQEKKRPRTIKEAMLQKNQLPGQKARLDGAAPQRPSTSVDAKATGFGAYDRAFIDAVSSRWYDLLDNMSYDGYQQGEVVVQFNLNYEGRITEMKVLKTTVAGILTTLCEKAVIDPAPFDRWPREMRLLVGEDSRRITFTFRYN